MASTIVLFPNTNAYPWALCWHNLTHIEILNAHELARNRTVNNSERGEYLTDYAYKFVENEFCLSKSGQAMKVSKIEYCVYASDNINKKEVWYLHFIDWEG